MSGPNAELAYRVLDQIDAHPEAWDQTTWQCGTSACFAGWAVRLSGGVMENVHGRTWDVIVADGLGELNGMDADEAAERLLGVRMPWREPEDDLFAQDNTREDLGRLVAEIFGPRPDGPS